MNTQPCCVNDYLPDVPNYAFWLAGFCALFCSLILALALAMALLLPLTKYPHWGLRLPEDPLPPYRGPRENGWISGTPKGLNAGSPDDKKNFNDSRAQCKSQNRRLAVFPTQCQEDEFVKLIKKRKDTVQCDEFFLGYRLPLEDPEYCNFKRKKCWPPPDTDQMQAATDIKDRECIAYYINPARVGRVRPCEEFSVTCVLFYHSEYEDKCKETPNQADCYRHDKGWVETPTNFKGAYKQTNTTDNHFEGILVADPRFVPKLVLDEVAKANATCVGLAGFLNRTYLNVYNKRKPAYKSKRWQNLEYKPEDACWAMNKTEGYKIKAVPCAKELCVVCV